MSSGGDTGQYRAGRARACTQEESVTLPSGSRVFLFPRTGNARVANTRRGYAPSPCSQPEARGGERQRARREPAWDGDGGMSAPSSGPFYPLLFTFNAMEVENSEPRPAGEGDVTRTATLRRWSTRLRPKLRELALAVADIAKAISLTLVSPSIIMQSLLEVILRSLRLVYAPMMNNTSTWGLRTMGRG